MTTSDEPRLLSPDEAGAILNVSGRTVIRWADAGRLELHSRTVGGHRRFTPAAVEELRAKLTRTR